MRRLWLAALLCLTAAIAPASAEPQEGRRPPAFSVHDLTGRSHTLSRYKGQWLVLHFWATWCPYCRGEIPELTQLAHAGATGANVLAISVDRDVNTLQQFLKQHPLPYPVVSDPDASLANQYGVEGLPTTFIIGPDGQVREILPGAGDLTGAVARARTTD